MAEQADANSEAPRNKYDEWVAYYTANPDEIADAWLSAGHSPSPKNALFAYLGVVGKKYADEKWCGCAAMVAGNPGFYAAAHPTVTAACTANPIFATVNDFVTDNWCELDESKRATLLAALPEFARVQHLADKLIRNAVH